jgi:hypothetical protein
MTWEVHSSGNKLFRTVQILQTISSSGDPHTISKLPWTVDLFHKSTTSPSSAIELLQTFCASSILIRQRCMIPGNDWIPSSPFSHGSVSKTGIKEFQSVKRIAHGPGLAVDIYERFATFITVCNSICISMHIHQHTDKTQIIFNLDIKLIATDRAWCM